jgi:branched-chain amino acid transport system ATP-binding protein
VDLAAPEGGVTIPSGRSGAGKTTTLRTIMRLWRARAGRIMRAGRNIADLPTVAIARPGIGRVPDDMGIFANRPVEESMVLAAAW